MITTVTELLDTYRTMLYLAIQQHKMQYDIPYIEKYDSIPSVFAPLGPPCWETPLLDNSICL